METENNTKACCCDNKKCHCKSNCSPCAVYGMGLIGSLVYFLQNTHGFCSVLLGIGKAIVWPAIVIFKLLAFLKL